MSYRVILKKKWTNNLGRTYPIGSIIQGDKELATKLIESKTGEAYDGDYPPREKVKTDLFKPKK